MEIRITLDRKPAWTVEMAAAAYGLSPGSMRKEITRAQLGHDEMLDGKKPLYLAASIKNMMDARPGRGSAGRGRPSSRKTAA